MAAGNPRVRFLGYLNEEQLQPFYRRAVAVIVPSVCYEAFPLVMIEAFRQQTPTIVRNLGGMPEVIDESKGGVTYNTNEELVTAMERLLSDPAARNEMGMSGYEAFRKKWTPEPHLRQYLDLIENVAAARGHKLD
jgi:glycosyltransferase involved in cell wall biosynthesis